MFTEVLNIKPVLDQGTAKAMETSLSSRFTRVAGRFGAGLKNVIKGSILGISLGLLNKILNPIEALDEKIKTMLGHGTDISEMADRFGTSGGKLKQIQDVAGSLGVKPDQLKELMIKFADAVDKAREEMANPLAVKSDSSLMVSQFVDKKDMAKSFENFLYDLRGTGASKTGVDTPMTQHALQAIAEAGPGGLSPEDRQDLIKRGEIRHRSGPEMQAEMERQVFGAQQFGGMKKLIGTNFSDQLQTIKEPTLAKLNEAVEKLAGLNAQKSIIEVQNQTKDMVNAASKMNLDMINAMEASIARQASEETKRLDTYESLKMGAKSIADIQQGFAALLDGVSVGLGHLQSITSKIPDLTNSSFLKNIAGFLHIKRKE